MGDGVREYVRAAQEAELRGDLPGAVELLLKAASLYSSSGRTNRALTMLRHAKRLAPERVELDEEIRLLEEPSTSGSTELSLEAEMLQILGLPGDSSPPLVERGPQRADPALKAWCSFCCRPGQEVGPLVAGPAGAFVCLGCTAHSARLLDAEGPSGSLPAEPPSAARTRQNRSGDLIGSSRSVELPTSRASTVGWSRSDDLIGSGPSAPAPDSPASPAQESALREIWALLGEGRSRILLIGPEGVGKSFVCGRLAESSGAQVATWPELPPDATPGAPMLIELGGTPKAGELDGLLELFDRHPGPVVLSVRGQAPVAAVHVITERAQVPIHGTSALVEATAGQVPWAVLERVDGVVTLAATGPDDLERLATALLQGRGEAPGVIEQLAAVLAREAFASGRGAHELVALLRRVPRGGRRVAVGGRSEEEEER